MIQGILSTTPMHSLNMHPSMLAVITSSDIQTLAFVLFCIGLIGVIVRRNILIIMMCVELMLNAVNLSFISFARQHSDVSGHAFVFIIIAMAAAEAAVGLSIAVAYFRTRRSISIGDARSLRH